MWLVYPRAPRGNPLPTENPPPVNLGPRAILLVVAIVLFVLAALTNASGVDLLAFGLACLAAAFVVDELGIGTRLGSRR